MKPGTELFMVYIQKCMGGGGGEGGGNAHTAEQPM